MQDRGCLIVSKDEKFNGEKGNGLYVISISAILSCCDVMYFYRPKLLTTDWNLQNSELKPVFCILGWLRVTIHNSDWMMTMKLRIREGINEMYGFDESLYSLLERIVKNRNKNVIPTERNLMRKMQRFETPVINKFIMTRVHDEFGWRRTKEG